MKNETEVRIIIISNPVGCPHRSQLGGCLALETNKDLDLNQFIIDNHDYFNSEETGGANDNHDN